MKLETLETMAASGSKATVAGASLSGYGWIVSNEFFGLMGVLIALAGLAMNLYYKRKADARIERETLLRMQERQMRMDLMRATQQPIHPPPRESDFAELGDQ